MVQAIGGRWPRTPRWALGLAVVVAAACSGRDVAPVPPRPAPAPAPPVAQAPRPAPPPAEPPEEVADASPDDEEEDAGPTRTMATPDGPPMYPPNEDEDPVAITDPSYGVNPEMPNAPRVGQTFPDFMLPEVRGGSFDLHRARENGPVMVVFYLGHWCPPCNEQLQQIDAAYDKFRFRDVEVVAISADDRDASTKWLEEQNFAFRMAVDVELRFIGQLHLEHPERRAAIHAIYLVDREGKIFYAKVGGRRPAVGELLDAIDYHRGKWPPAA